MGKLIFWIVVFFLVLLALRLVSVHKTRREERERRDEAQPRGQRDDKPAQDVMVKCGRCGVFVPRGSTVMTRSGIACADPDCSKKR